MVTRASSPSGGCSNTSRSRSSAILDRRRIQPAAHAGLLDDPPGTVELDDRQLDVFLGQRGAELEASSGSEPVGVRSRKAVVLEVVVSPGGPAPEIGHEIE